MLRNLAEKQIRVNDLIAEDRKDGIAVNDQLINRIRKILAKTTENNCTQEEADTAFALANKLMLEHNISMAIIQETSQEDEVFGDCKVDEFGKYTIDIGYAVGICQDFFFVKGITFRTGYKNSFKLAFFGSKENAIAAKYVYDGLIAAFENLWIAYRRKNKRPASERQTFICGVRDGFSYKLRQERQNTVNSMADNLRVTAPSTELVLQSVQEKMLEKFGEVHAKVKDRKIVFSGGSYNEKTREAGFNAGKNLNINRPIGQTTKVKGVLQ